MKILLTGANGYIGKRLLPILVSDGHDVHVCVRDKAAFSIQKQLLDKIHIHKVDFLKTEEVKVLPTKMDAAYFLIHSLTSVENEVSEKEKTITENFNLYATKVKLKQVIYLGGISNDQKLSTHLESRQETEKILKKTKIPLTVLRAAIVIGSGGASFEIIRDLVEKLPIMVTPKWLNTKCQPISIRNVIEYLTGVLGNEKAYDQTFDIGGPDILTYKEMLLQFAEVRGLHRKIFTLPVMTPRLSSFWLYFVTSTSYQIAVNLVESMKNEVVVKLAGIEKVVPLKRIPYRDAVKLAFEKIEQNMVASSWTDAQLPGMEGTIDDFIEIPKEGTLQDCKTIVFPKQEKERILNNIWAIGGERGWYYGKWMWSVRGHLDKFFGGVGLRRGRRSPIEIYAGDSLDFWRVLLADKERSRLLLYAEMKLPGEAWLEFSLNEHKEDQAKMKLVQTATFRPKGIAGRLYWYSMLPFHHFIFANMAERIVGYNT